MITKKISLLDETYSTEKVKNWCVKIADQVNLRLRDLSKQKYLIQVVILQKLGQGFKLVSFLIKFLAQVISNLLPDSAMSMGQ